jgi:hypothetical protein
MKCPETKNLINPETKAFGIRSRSDEMIVIFAICQQSPAALHRFIYDYLR